MNMGDYVAERPITPEVVVQSPAVPVRENALAVFRSDPAALKASALTALDFKVRVIQTAEAASDLADRISQVRLVQKNIEARRKQIVEPLRKEAKAVDEEAHRWSDPLVKWVDDATRALGAYMRLEADRKRREEETRQKALVEAAEAQAAAETAGDAAAVEAASVAIATIETQAPVEVVKGFKTEAGTISTRKTWKVEVVDESLVPDAYLVVDLKKLQAAVDAGARKIEGCNIYEHEGFAVRTRG